MDDEQCDLETLSAFLDEDSNDTNSAPQLMKHAGVDNSPPDEDEELCFSDSDDEADLDALASLVEDDSKIQDATKDEVVSSLPAAAKTNTEKMEKMQLPKTIPNAETSNEAKLQEELRKMQEKMEQLQHQLLQQQQSSPKAEKVTTPQSNSLTMAPSSTNTNTNKEPSKLAQKKNSKDEDVNPFFADEAAGKTGRKNLKVENTPTNGKEAFFPDSDSDWDDMDGEKESSLSKEGQSIKKLLKKSGQRPREAHTASYSPSAIKNQIPEARWRKKADTASENSLCQKSPSVSLSSKFSAEKEDVMFFSGIRIINPKVSSDMLKLKMDGRKMMKMSRLSSKINSADLEGNWVTFGVLVNKSESRKSANGNTYSIWKLSDLEDEDKTMTFFLFREVYKQHWKCQVGAVLGLLNPNLMQKAEKFQSENSFTVDHPGQILLVGQSKDLGTCRATTKSGKPCSSFINKRQGEFCKYHVQSVYKKASAKRTDLQSGFTGVVPKSFERKIIPSGSHVFYGGQTFSTLSTCGKPANRKSVSLKQLQSHNTVSGGKVTTLSLHELQQTKQDKESSDATKLKEQPFLDYLTTPTVGSLNLVKHLVSKESTAEKNPADNILVESITPSQLLKQHKQQMNQLKQRQAQKAASAGASPKLPQLGRGFKPGDDIFFANPSSSTPTQSHRRKMTHLKNPDLAKKQAVAKVLAKGGIAKVDPNAVRKNKTSPEISQRIRKRVAENVEPDDPVDRTEPPAKRSRYLGSVDLNSENVQKLLKSRSSHSGALAELEADRREKYFGELEKKEMYEDKMTTITELKCTAYTCHQCKYTALSTSDLCKTEGHKVSQVKTAKRFFQCNDCKTRTMTLHRYPTIPCRSCRGISFVKTSMWKEKEGPKLECEILHLTGDVVKHLDSQIK